MSVSLGGGYLSPFYNPGQYVDPNYGNYYYTPMGTQQREQNMPAAWYAYGRNLGIPDNNSAYGRWFNQQQPLYAAGFASASMENPYMRIDDYNASLGNYQDWQSRFNAMAPQTRGENPGNYGNVTRWLGW